jgi:hypothetical protein
MPLRVMEQLGLKTTRPYRNVCAMDSREVKVFGIIKNLVVHLVVYPDIAILMDVVVIDIPDSWGMLLSRKFSTDLGGSLQMDISYATIPTQEGTFVTLYREQFKRYHVEDPKEPMNEFVYTVDDNMGNYAILFHSYPMSLMKKKIRV